MSVIQYAATSTKELPTARANEFFLCVFFFSLPCATNSHRVKSLLMVSFGANTRTRCIYFSLGWFFSRVFCISKREKKNEFKIFQFFFLIKSEEGNGHRWRFKRCSQKGWADVNTSPCSLSWCVMQQYPRVLTIDALSMAHMQAMSWGVLRLRTKW